MHRSAAYFASLSGDLDLALLFVDARNCNTADNIWGRTPLHVGAERGDGDFVRFLMGMDASIYARDKDGRTPEELAAQAGHREVEAFLREQRFDAPGQLATTLTVGDDATTSVWIGDHVRIRICSTVPLDMYVCM
jgi:ankyrin repeat protein